MFKISDNDGKLVVKAKEEANGLLSLLSKEHGKDSDIVYHEYYILKHVIDIFKVLDVGKQHNMSLSKDILNYVNKLQDTQILYPLTLNEDEFEFIRGEGNKQINKRNIFIYKHTKGIYYTNSYNIIINKYYNHDTNKEIDYSKLLTIEEPIIPYKKVYITSGGVTTGEYFDKTYLYEDTVAKHNYTPATPINIPISLIKDYGYICTIDKREPKFRALKQFYSVPILYDEEIKSKYDIRRYEKLTKSIKEKDKIISV